MSDDRLPVSFSRETLNEVKSLLRGADPDAPLVDRLRKPRTPYSPALLREEAAALIEALTAERDALGMVAWREEYGEAKQKLRLIHPLTWVWVVSMVIYGVLSQGIPDTIDDLGYSLKHDTVWF